MINFNDNASLGIRKAAVLLMNLEMEKPGSTKPILTNLGEDLSRKILREMSQIDQVKSDEAYGVFADFYDGVINNKVTYGGRMLPTHLFSQSFSETKGASLFETKSDMFEFLNDVSDDELMDLFKQESLQLVAVILNYLAEDRVAKLMGRFSKDQNILISDQLVNLNIPNYALIKQLELALKSRLTSDVQLSGDDDEAIIKLARSIEIMGQDQKEAILAYFASSQADVASKLKSYMFGFEDLISLTDKDLQTILHTYRESKQLAIALHGIEEAFSQKIIDNLSKRFFLMYEEEMKQLDEAELTTDAIDSARSGILSVARQLEKQGQIATLKKVTES